MSDANFDADLDKEDNFERLLGKNGELLEERKKQVLVGALGIVQRYCEETPNKMEVVAALFCRKLGEEFKIKCPTGRIIRCRFSKKGLWYQETDKWNHDWFITDMLIAKLIRGEAVIVDEE